MERFEIAILGAGPAGVSAAITAAQRGKKPLLLGEAKLSDKLLKAAEIRNYPGLPSISGADLAAAFRRHLQDMGLSVTPGRASAVYQMGDYYAIQTTDNEMYEATAVILATGVTPGRPLPGEEALLGRGVSYCATCDAPLYRGKTVAVLGYGRDEEKEAEYLGTVVGKVLYFPQYKAEPELTGPVEVLHETPVSVASGEQGKILTTNAGGHTVDGIFILRQSVFPAQLVPGLETDQNKVKVDRQMATNLAGLFACGDLTGQPYQYAKSVGEGNVAALSAAAYVDGLKKK
jgi:thioredoxin reductase (NADPH)